MSTWIKARKLLITSSILVFSCSEPQQSYQSQAIIENFVLKDYYRDKVQWTLQAQQAELFLENRSKIKQIQFELIASKYPIHFKSPRGTHGEKGVTLQSPVQVEIPTYHLRLDLSFGASWKRKEQTLVSTQVKIESPGFSGSGKALKTKYPYEKLVMSGVIFRFKRD